MRGLIVGLRRSLSGYAMVIRALANLLPVARAFLCAIVRALRSLGGKHRQRAGCCIEIPSSEHKRADPLIYSQSHLMAQGLSVTWDNPDIQLMRDGVAVGSGLLEPATDYDVVVRVWNGSYDAPAIGLPVELSFLSFGAGNPSTFVGTDIIDLGAKATSSCPAYARFKWRTPEAPGHYCLQARLIWADDANPDNNLGQENTNVGHTQSPAKFRFKFRNAWGERRRIEFEADSYQLREPPLCPEEKPPGRRSARPESRLTESRRRWAAARPLHGHGVTPIPAGWTVKLTPATVQLDAWADIDVDVEITPPEQGFEGRQAFNIACFGTTDRGHRAPAGGVTLYVEKG